MKEVQIGDGENSTVVIRDRYGQVIAVFAEIQPGVTKEYSLAVDELTGRPELPKAVSNFHIVNEFK